jgi:UDP-glucose 4-epimerase
MRKERDVYLITGGAGFIGSHLVERLVRDGEKVRVFDVSSKITKSNHLAPISDAIDVIEGDIRDPDAISHAMGGVHVVFHLAAEVSVSQSVAHPITAYDVNVMGTLNVLNAARQGVCRRVVFASSSAVYGESPELPKHEKLLPIPVSPYAATKLAGEHLCSVYSRMYGLETVALRYFNVFGPRQDPFSPYAAAIPRFIATLQRNERPTIFGDGEQTRDFVYVTDVVDANIRAATRSGVSGNVYNIASGRPVSVNKVLAVLARLIGVEVRPIYASPRPGDVPHSVADVSLAMNDLGFEPRVPFEEGLTQTVTTLASS